MAYAQSFRCPRRFMSKILIVEDDQALCHVVREGLKADNHSVEVAHDGSEAMERLLQYMYDLIILDWELPHVNGVSLCEKFRARGGNAPVLMLTAKSKVDDKEAGFEAGVDDYLTKPFELRELRSRIKALLRRPAQIVIQALASGDLELDPHGRKVKKAGSNIHLSPKEFDLLEYLIRNKGVVLSADHLLNAVWSAEESVGTDTVRTHMKNLRAKIDTKGEPSYIGTVFAVGYRFDSPDDRETER